MLHRDERRETLVRVRLSIRLLVTTLIVLGGLAGNGQAAIDRLSNRLHHLKHLSEVLAVNRTDNPDISVHKFASGMSLIFFDDKMSSDVELGVRVNSGSVDELKGEGKWPVGTAHLLEAGLLINMALERDRIVKALVSETNREKTEFLFKLTGDNFPEGFHRISKQLFDYQADSRIKFAFRKIREQ